MVILYCHGRSVGTTEFILYREVSFIQRKVPLYIIVYILTVTLFVSVVIPSISSLVSSKVIQQSKINTLLCQAVGEPVPDISWYFNSVMINVSDDSSKYMIMSRSLNITTTENTLTVYNVTSSDVGVYTCTATNIIGSDTNNGEKYIFTYMLFKIPPFIFSQTMDSRFVHICKTCTTVYLCSIL